MKDFLFAPEQARTPVARAVGRRARPADAGARAGASRPTCWCSTSRPTISTSKRSTCCRRCSATMPAPCILDQPRPRFPRPRRHRGDRAGGRRPLDRICRRLFRHAGAARRRPVAREADEARRRRREAEAAAAAAPKPQAGKRRLSFNEKHALETLPKHDGGAAGQDRDAAAAPRRSRPLRPRPQGVRRRHRPRSPPRRPSWPPPRRNGWSWKSCAKRSRGK